MVDVVLLMVYVVVDVKLSIGVVLYCKRLLWFILYWFLNDKLFCDWNILFFEDWVCFVERLEYGFWNFKICLDEEFCMMLWRKREMVWEELYLRLLDSCMFFKDLFFWKDIEVDLKLVKGVFIIKLVNNCGLCL